MITQEDKNILRDVGRKYILDIALDSQLLKNKLTFQEHVNLCNSVTKLSYEDVIRLTVTEDIKEFEGKFKKFLKYSFAAIAGIAKGAVLGPLGPPIAMFVLYIFRKLTDTCSKSCFNKFPMSRERKVCRYECQVNAARKITAELRNEISKCSGFQNPEKCEKKLRKEYVKWAKRLQQQIVKLQQAKLRMREKAFKARQSDNATGAAESLAAKYNLSKADLMNVLKEDKQFRQSIPFREHIKLYKTVQKIREQGEGGPIVQATKINPKKEKYARMGLYLGLWAVPVPFFNDAVNHIIKKHDFACIAKCAKQKKFSQKLCRTQCAYMSAKYAVQMLNKQKGNCKKAEKPFKCENSILKLLSDWKQREVERKIKFDAAYREELRRAKKREEK